MIDMWEGGYSFILMGASMKVSVSVVPFFLKRNWPFGNAFSVLFCVAQSPTLCVSISLH